MKDKTFRKSLFDFKNMLYVIDPKKGEDIHSNWTIVDKAVLEVANGEINSHTDMSFTYKPIYDDRLGRGRKPVEHVEFGVFYQAKLEPKLTISIAERHIKTVSVTTRPS